jgi:hypothetical protein
MGLEARISAMIAAWRSVGQHEHADALRAKMRELLAPFYGGQG